MNAGDLLECRDLCVAFLRDALDDDWSSTVPDLDINAGQIVRHMAGAHLWYAIDLSAQGADLAAVNPEIKADAEPVELIAALKATAGILAAVITTTPPGVRGFHPFGQADASGFSAIGCDELLIHTHDIARCMNREFTPASELADKVRSRLFPWGAVHPDPWTALQWANGRIALADHERVSKWKWHCAPLDEWDGSIP